MDSWSISELRSSYEGRISDLKSALDEAVEQKNFYQKLLLRNSGILRDAPTAPTEPLRMNTRRQTPGQVAAKLESDLRRRYWEAEALKNQVEALEEK